MGLLIGSPWHKLPACVDQKFPHKLEAYATVGHKLEAYATVGHKLEAYATEKRPRKSEAFLC